MNKYELGTMSTVWHVEAPNVDVATLAVMLSRGVTAPVVNYPIDGEGKAVVSEFAAGCFDENISTKIAKFLEKGDNRELIRKASKTIREVGL